MQVSSSGVTSAVRHKDTIARPSDPLIGAGSAACVCTLAQRLRYACVCSAATLLVLWDYKIAFTVVSFAICGFYAAAIGYKLLCVSLSVWRSPEVRIPHEAAKELAAADLPVYTILVPLFGEANVVPQLVDALTKLDYPADRLDVKLLVEIDDVETTAACRQANLPPRWDVIVVPAGMPRTKPRACNSGLAQARGEFLVIYDAEDRPEPDQLRKAVAAFRRTSGEVICLQCKLNYYNAGQNWLTRFFTLEYTAWFDLFLPGLHRLNMPIPLGGTSNHFRVDALRRLGGWDAYNVAEDCDLGIRIAEAGYRTMILDSTTWEEANSRLWNWIRQRSRWVKGYLQTHLVHTRHPLALWRRLGLRGGLSVLLTVGGLAAVLLLNPVYWLVALLWLCIRWRLVYFDFTDSTMQHYTAWSKLSWVFFGASLLLFLANGVFVLISVAACSRRRQWSLLPYAILSPLYWILMSIGAWKGFIQLLWNPSYWEKTEHGLTAGVGPTVMSMADPQAGSATRGSK